ncbi:hypothetical protein HPULCUR_004504 [Helicostylum pulchrum]|uniref:Uncharacterized protein n=1 Tax=Helicostylum pulchrum TaxID=562976 RepID=A0ABP9XWD6_9FUNG
MTDYQNRAERRSVQLVELRKIRTENKQEMKASRSKYFNYNTKKFRKTLFYQHLKQASQMNTAVDSPATGTYQEEGHSPLTDTTTALYSYGRTPITEVYQEEGKIRVIYDRTNQTVENTHATDITEEDFSIQTDKRECDAVEASSSGTGTVAVMTDEEAKVIVKDVNSTQDLGKNKKGAEEPLDEKDDDVRKDDEAVQQQQQEEEMFLVSEKKIDSSFYEKSMKEVAWTVTPLASIEDVIREETASLLITPPQSITGFALSVTPSIMGRVKKSAANTAIR